MSCNGKGFPTNNNPTINIPNGFNNDVGVKNVVAKVDFKVNERQNISGTYFFGNNSGTVEDFPELQPNWLSVIHTRAQVVGGNWLWAPNAHWVNEARVGYSRLYQPTLPGDIEYYQLQRMVWTQELAVHLPAGCLASVLVATFSPDSGVSSGRSFRGLTLSFSLTTTFPTRLESTR